MFRSGGPVKQFSDQKDSIVKKRLGITDLYHRILDLLAFAYEIDSVSWYGDFVGGYFHEALTNDQWDGSSRGIRLEQTSSIRLD